MPENNPKIARAHHSSLSIPPVRCGNLNRSSNSSNSSATIGSLLSQHHSFRRLPTR